VGHKKFTCLNTADSLPMTIVGPKRSAFVGQESGYFCWYAILSGNQHSLKAPYIINSHNFRSVSKNMGSHFFTSCAVNANTAGVPNNVLYLHNVFKRYTPHTVCCSLMFDTGYP